MRSPLWLADGPLSCSCSVLAFGCNSRGCLTLTCCLRCTAGTFSSPHTHASRCHIVARASHCCEPGEVRTFRCKHNGIITCSVDDKFLVPPKCNMQRGNKQEQRKRGQCYTLTYGTSLASFILSAISCQVEGEEEKRRRQRSMSRKLPPCDHCGRTDMIVTDPNKSCEKCGLYGCLDCNPISECELCSAVICSTCLESNGICTSCNEALHRNRNEDRYGEEGQQQVCLNCNEVRKIWYAPFEECRGGCGRFICDRCFEGHAEFCDYCLQCGKCSTLISCANCGTYRCSPKEDDACGICQCPECKEGTCDECEECEKCCNCGSSISPGWYTQNKTAGTDVQDVNDSS